MNIVVHLFSTMRTICDDVTLMSRRTELVHPVAKKYLHSGFRSRNRPGSRERAAAPGPSHQVCVCVCVGMCGWVFGGRRETENVCARKVTSRHKLLIAGSNSSDDDDDDDSKDNDSEGNNYIQKVCTN